VLPQDALVERIGFPPPAALCAIAEARFGVLLSGRLPMAAYAPPQAGEVKQAPPCAGRCVLWTPESVHGLFAEPLARRRMIREQTRMLGRWWRGEGVERLAGSVDFDHALTREVLRTELVRIKSLIVTAAGFLIVLWAVDLVDPEGLDNIWRGRFRPRYLSAILIPFILFELPWQYQPASQARPRFAGAAAIPWSVDRNFLADLRAGAAHQEHGAG
jgi:hypothetical protein